MKQKKSQQYSENITWIKNNEITFQSKNFIYESCVYLYESKRFSLINKSYYESPKELNIVYSFWKTKHIEICCTLYSAPKEWLIKNNFKLYEQNNNITE
jgi:hypothetical protein